MSDAGALPRLELIPRDSARGILAALLAAALLLFGLTLGSDFLNTRTVQSIAFQIPELGILSLAMMVTMICGGINLSLVATANLTGLTIAYLLGRAGPDPGAPLILVATLGGLAIALFIGVVNGILIAYVGVSPILATLGTMTLVKGVAVGFTRGNVLSGFPPAVLAIGNGTVLGVPVPALVFLVLVVLLGLLLKRTPFGVRLYMMGSNMEATRYSGIDTRAALVKVYVLSSLLAGVAAVIMMARFNSTNASYGESYLLVTVLAAVLGGIDPFGGFGRVIGLLLALLLLQVVSSGLNALGVSSHLTMAIWGLILLSATAVQSGKPFLSTLFTYGGIPWRR